MADAGASGAGASGAGASGAGASGGGASGAGVVTELMARAAVPVPATPEAPTSALAIVTGRRCGGHLAPRASATGPGEYGFATI